MAGNRNVVARLDNLRWELRLGVSTRGRVEVDYPDAHRYASMNYSSIFETLHFLSPKPADTFIDIGSGRGRVLCCAARYPITKVIGVDLTTAFCADASSNAARMRGRRAPIVVHNVNATEFDYADGDVYYLFDPFGADTLTNVLEKIRDDRGDKPVRFAYANPTHEIAFTTQPWLERYEFWDKAKTGGEHSVSFYRTKA